MATQSPDILKKDGTINEKATGSTVTEAPSGNNQQNPHPNENTSNRPYSLSETERFGDGTDDGNDATESAGVTQGHSSPTTPKHGNHAEGGSSGGKPEGDR